MLLRRHLTWLRVLTRLQNFWKWIVGPGTIWLADRIWLLFGHRRALASICWMTCPCSRCPCVARSHETQLERVELLPGRVTKLVVRAPKRFKFHCGEVRRTRSNNALPACTADTRSWHPSAQYAFIKVPALSGVEWHPFTISSSALRPDRFTFHVRGLVRRCHV